MGQALPLNSETAGEILQKELFIDLYEEVFNDNNFYFWRLSASGNVEAVIVFHDIEDFDRSLETQAVVDCKVHKDRFFLVIWTSPDPINPLGFPIGFTTSDEKDQQAIEQLFHQSEIAVHYLTIVDDEILHIYSQSIEFTEEEKKGAKTVYQEEAKRTEITEDEDRFHARDQEELTDEVLSEIGLGYLLDFSALKNKADEEKAREKFGTAILTALEMFKNHPNAQVRESSFLIWAGDKREKNQVGEDAIMLEFFITPPLNKLLDIVSDNQTKENPISTVLLAFPEFLTTVDARPVDRGAYPLLQYTARVIWHLAPDDRLQSRLAAISKAIPNPYTETTEDIHG